MSKFRSDRALTLSPLPRLLKLGHTRTRIPVLMYHGIQDGTMTASPYFETNTSPAVFEMHLQFLRDQGYSTVCLSEAINALRLEKKEQRFVVITFDDGLSDFYGNAFPLLVKYGLNATLFVVSDFVGKRGIGRQGRDGRKQDFMTWQEIREINAHGVQIGSHTVSHPNLYHTSPQNLECEIRLSKQTIEDNIGQPVRSFAYPFAFPEQDRMFVRNLRGVLEASEYDNGVCTVIGTACRRHNRFFLPRIPINCHDDFSLFRAKLAGDYDWLHIPQYAFKSMKRLRDRFGAPSNCN
jgi:peptidoglycan/xylan/chitin deacetylase (PgdA/CDA1 family)